MAQTKTEKHLNAIFGVDPPEEKETAPVAEDQHPLPANYRPTTDLEILSKEEIAEIENQEFKDLIDDDYKLARDNIKNLLIQGQNLLDLAVSVAESNEDAKSIGTASEILGQMTNINEKLLNLTKQKQDIYVRTRPKYGIGGGINSNNTQDNSVTKVETQNNIVFTGTTSDLAKLISEMKSSGEIKV